MRPLILLPLLAACAAPLPVADWTVETGPRGARLTLADATSPILTLACDARTREIAVRAWRFTPVPSNEEFSIGTEADAWLLVADPLAPIEGVVAGGPIPAGLLPALEVAREIGASYGPDILGPVPTGPEVAAFARACG